MRNQIISHTFTTTAIWVSTDIGYVMDDVQTDRCLTARVKMHSENIHGVRVLLGVFRVFVDPVAYVPVVHRRVPIGSVKG